MVGRMRQQMKAFKLVEQPVRVDQSLAELRLREQDLARRHGVELNVICRQRPCRRYRPFEGSDQQSHSQQRGGNA